MTWLEIGGWTSLILLAIWLWRNYFARSDVQWSHQEARISELKEDRDHWRDVAMAKHEQLEAQHDIASELRKQNAALKEQNAQLRAQNETLKEEKKLLTNKVNRLEKDMKELKNRK